MKPGEKTAVHIEEAKGICYVWIDKNGLVSAIIADDQYPAKVAFQIINDVFKEFYAAFDFEKVAVLKSSPPHNSRGL